MNAIIDVLDLDGTTFHGAIVRTRSGKLRLNVVRVPACSSVEKTRTAWCGNLWGWNNISLRV